MRGSGRGVEVGCFAGHLRAVGNLHVTAEEPKRPANTDALHEISVVVVSLPFLVAQEQQGYPLWFEKAFFENLSPKKGNKGLLWVTLSDKP